ncbi:hypothetical protein GQ54DRAFT_333058 [Martensiomyces pterosporus]|nr:hypothetical protein GQ54DRAFT_333058 [Martensiomyces pterosporus]
MGGAIYYSTSALRPLRVVLSSVDLALALVTLILAIALSARRRELLKITIFRVILVLQVLGVLKSLFELLVVYIEPDSSGGCRVFVFLSIVFAITPLYISVFCILYFQIVLISKVPHSRLWPKVLMVLGILVFSLLPESFILYIPPRTAGIDSYCKYTEIPSTRTFVFKWLVCYAWIVLAGLIGICSIIAIAICIIRRSREASDEASSSSNSLSTACSTGVASIRRQRKRRSSTMLIIKTLRSIVWFPVMPIVSLWFSTVYLIVVYRNQRAIASLAIADACFQFLEVLFMAMTFYFSPPVRRAYLQLTVDENKEKGGMAPSLYSHDDQERHLNQEDICPYAMEGDDSQSLSSQAATLCDIDFDPEAI